MKKDILSKINSFLNKFDIVIYLFIILIPLTHKEMFSLYDPDLVLSKWVLALISVAGFYYFIKYRNQFKKDIFYIFLSSVLIGQIFSLFVSLDREDTLRLIAFQAAITFSYPVFRKYTDKHEFKSLFNVYLFSFFLVIAFLVWQIIYQKVFGKLTGGIWPVPGYPTRYGSTFWDVNHFGAYLSSMIFLFLGCFFTYFKRKSSKVFLLGALLGLVALKFTDSRSAGIGFIAGSLLFWGFAFKEKIHEKAKIKNPLFQKMYSNGWLWGSFLFSSGIISFLYIFSNPIHKAFFYRSTSFFSHLYLLKAGVNLAIQNFSSGIGANAFYAYFKQSEWASAYYYIDRAALNYKLPLHNLWLEVFVETGIISFVIFTTMWIVGIGLLVKLFRKKNDFLALGLASGLISFLIGGLFYSYKSEFFWIYVILAFVYGSKDLDSNVIVEKFKDAKYIFYYIFENDYRFRKTLMVSLSITAVLSLTVYLFNPLLLKEVDIFYRYVSFDEVNLWTDPFSYLINLLRYSLGNYSFTGRVIPVIYYLASYVLFIGVFARFVKFYKSIVLSGILMSIIAIFYPPTVTSSSYLIIYFVGILIYIGILLLKKHTTNYKIDYRILAGFLLLFNIAAHVSVYQHMYTESYDKDASFIVELAANRGVLTDAVIWIENPNEYSLVKFYSDHILPKGKNTLRISEEKVNTFDKLRDINFANKNVFIVTGLNKYYLEESIDFSDVIKHRDYYILIAEPEALAVSDYQ